MGFWSDVVRSINPFAREDLSSPEARERKAYRAASSLYFLQYVRPFVERDLSVAKREARSHVESFRKKVRTQAGRKYRPTPEEKAWREKLGFLVKYGYSFKHEVARAFRESGGLPQDIKQRAQYLAREQAGQFMQQYPPRDFAPFSSFSPPFIRKY